jgi:uncharacterized protein involved in exopolysaccharide biosynthesis
MKTNEALVSQDQRNTNEILVAQDQRPLPTLQEVGLTLTRWRWAVLATFLLIVTAVIISGIWMPEYEATMKIMVSRQRSDAIVTPSDSSPVQVNGDRVSEEDLNSEIELINSEDLLRNVVLATGLGQKTNSAPSEASIAKAVRRLSKELKLEAVRKTNVISIRYANRDPKMAAAVLRALATAYIDKHIEVHRPHGEFAFFDQQAKQYQQRLGQAQDKLTSFTKTSGVVSADSERDSALQQAAAFDSAARQAQSTLEEAQKRLQTLNAELKSVAPRMTTAQRTTDNPQLQEHLKSTLLTLQLKRTELLTKYDPSYSLVKEVDQQIAEASSAIASEKLNPIREETTDQNPTYSWLQGEIARTQTELTGLRSRAASSAAIADRYRTSARALEQDSIIQQDLLRQAKTQEENYLLYTRKREEARISNALDRGGILNVAIAEQPIVPAIAVGSSTAVVFLTLFLATIMSISTAFVMDYAKRTFQSGSEITGYLGTPVLAVLAKDGA